MARAPHGGAEEGPWSGPRACRCMSVEGHPELDPPRGMTRRSAARSFFQASHRQLIVLLASGVLLAASVVGLTAANLANAQRPLDRIDPRLLTASAHLDSAARRLADASKQFTNL